MEEKKRFSTEDIMNLQNRSGIRQSFKYIDVLTSRQIEELHHGVLKVLKETGVVVKDPEMRNSLASYGCVVADHGERVYFSENIVEQALAKTSKGFEVKARNEKNSIKLQPGVATYFINGCGNSYFRSY